MADLLGQQLGNYRLLRLLGRGGFAEVYLGEHIHLGAQAAIKVLHTHLGNQDVEQFRSEARTIVRLVHPHIVRVLDFDVREGVPFLVMDYAPNGSLRERHPRGTRLPLPLVVTYIKQVADALQYAHEQRFIHRDVKPENMLLGRRDEVVLSDFGIATIAHQTSSQSVQVMAGTIPYMAPEQIQGKPRPASDQYALGIVVYEWLSGDRPFQGSFTEIATQHVLTPPPPLAQKLPSISAEVEQVVLTALAKDPKQRFGSVKAFATALEQASQTIPTHPGDVAVQMTEEKRGTPPSEPRLSTPVMTPPNQSAVSTEPATSPGQTLLSTEPVSTEPITSPSQAGATSGVAVPSSLAEPLLPAAQSSLAPSQSGQPAESSALPPTVFLSSNPSPMVPLSGSVGEVPPLPASSVGNVWGLNRGKIIIMLVGTILCGGLSFLGEITFPECPCFFVYAIPTALVGSVYIQAPYFSILLILSLLTTLTAGAISGPWVGLVTGGVGSFLGFYLTGFGTQYHLPGLWQVYLIYAAEGFTTGLAFLLTKGRYNTVRSLAIAAGSLLLGWIIGTGIVYGQGILSGAYLLGPLISGELALFLLGELIPSLIILFVYDRLMQRRRHAH